MSYKQRPIEILFIENDEADLFLAKEFLSKEKILNNIDVAGDGEEAIKKLFDPKQGKPDIIFLDIDLPKINGIEVLKEIKNASELKNIPVVILTVSERPQDILRAYDLQASGYMLKPFDVDQFKKIIRAFDKFSFQIVTTP